MPRSQALTAIITAAALAASALFPAQSFSSTQEEVATQPTTELAISAEEREANVQSFDLVWTLLRDRYYDPEMGGVDWEAARVEFRPKVEAAASRDEARGHIQALMDLLGESHLVVIPAEGYDALQAVAEAGEEDAEEDVESDADEEKEDSDADKPGGVGETGLIVRAVELEGKYAALVIDVLPDTPAADSGIKPGSLILTVNGKPLPEMIGMAAEGMPERMREGPMRPFVLDMAAGSAINGGGESRGTSVELTYDDGTGEQAATVKRAKPSGEINQLGNLPPMAVRIRTDRIEREGITAQYATFSNFFDPVRLMGTLRDSVRVAREDDTIDGYVLDLRGNGGGLLGMGAGVAGLFVGEEGHTLGTMIQRQMTLKNVIFPQKGGLEKPIAILVDAGSASMSEIFAGGMQELGQKGVVTCQVFGQNTAGAALPSEPARLPNGDGLIYVVADHTLPSGRRLEGIGVEPDVTIPLDEKAIEVYRSGTDPVLSAALNWIKSQSK